MLVQSDHLQRSLTSVAVAAAELAVQQLMKLHQQSVLTSAAAVAVLGAAGLAAVAAVPSAVAAVEGAVAAEGTSAVALAALAV